MCDMKFHILSFNSSFPCADEAHFLLQHSILRSTSTTEKQIQCHVQMYIVTYVSRDKHLHNVDIRVFAAGKSICGIQIIFTLRMRAIFKFNAVYTIW